VSYIALGGSRPSTELLDYLNDVIPWPGREHDIAAVALNERCQELGLGVPVRYSDEF
jgi:hypothetical protein